jgi:isopenicillin-N N-acyltransferase like protein
MIELHGTAGERGRQHGEALRAQIGNRIDTTVAEAVRDDQPGLRELIAPWQAAIEQWCPLVLEELRGISIGASRPLAEIILINAFEAFELGQQVELGGCTAIGVAGTDGAVIGQNWDANASLAASVDIHRHTGADTAGLVVVASPGGLGWIGMNEHGVALVNNDLLTKGTRHGLASQPARRRALQAVTTTEAIRLLTDSACVGGRSYMLGDALGHLATVELAAHMSPSIVAHAHRAAHTNHAHSSDIAGDEDHELLATTYPSSWERLRRAEELMDDSSSSPIEGIRSALTDHAGFPLSICRHESVTEPTVTAASVVFDCRARIAHIALGNACTSPTVSIEIGDAKHRSGS